MDGHNDNWLFFVNALLVGGLIAVASWLQQGITTIVPTAAAPAAGAVSGAAQAAGAASQQPTAADATTARNPAPPSATPTSSSQANPTPVTHAVGSPVESENNERYHDE